MRRTTEDRLRAIVQEQATQWCLRLRDGEKLTAADKAAFLDWLRQSPLNVREYLALRAVETFLPAGLAGLDVDLADAQKDNLRETDNVVHLALEHPGPIARARNRLGRRVGKFALVATLLLACAAYWLVKVPLTSNGFQVIEVPHGEQRTVQLQDGSVMHLNASSLVSLQYGRKERLIELERGQALFEVARDPHRPFHVRAGRADVVAIGTQFDVYRQNPDLVTVTVIQGQVQVAPLGHTLVNGGSGRAPSVESALRVSAGERVQLEAAGTPRVEPADVNIATAWIHREIAFDRRPLAEIAAEINRYSPVPIDIEDPSLRELRVSGVLDAFDSDSLLLFLGQYGEVEVGKRAILIHRRAPQLPARSVTATADR